MVCRLLRFMFSYDEYKVEEGYIDKLMFILLYKIQLYIILLYKIQLYINECF